MHTTNHTVGEELLPVIIRQKLLLSIAQNLHLGNHWAYYWPVPLIPPNTADNLHTTDFCDKIQLLSSSIHNKNKSPSEIQALSFGNKTLLLNSRRPSSRPWLERFPFYVVKTWFLRQTSWGFIVESFHSTGGRRGERPRFGGVHSFDQSENTIYITWYTLFLRI